MTYCTNLFAYNFSFFAIFIPVLFFLKSYVFFVFKHLLQNLNCLDNRKEWPLSVMLEVLKQLMEETPDNLLAKYVLYLKENMLICIYDKSCIFNIKYFLV